MRTSDRLIPLFETPLRLIDDPAFQDESKHEEFMAEMPNMESFIAKRVTASKEAVGIAMELLFLYQEPLLDRHQERHLFRKMNLLKWKIKRYLQDVDIDQADDGDIDQVEKWVEEVTCLKKQIIYSNARLTISVAKKQREYWNRTSIEVLLMLSSDAMMGLVRAVDYFDYTKGFKFSTYATFAMYDTLKRARHDRTKHQHQNDVTGEDMLALEPDPESVEDYRGGNFERMQEAALVTKYLKYLHPRERHIVTKSFGLDGTRIQKLRELAKDLLISKERVRQIKNRGLEKLKRCMQEEDVIIRR